MERHGIAEMALHRTAALRTLTNWIDAERPASAHSNPVPCHVTFCTCAHADWADLPHKLLYLPYSHWCALDNDKDNYTYSRCCRRVLIRFHRYANQRLYWTHARICLTWAILEGCEPPPHTIHRCTNYTDRGVVNSHVNQLARAVDAN